MNHAWETMRTIPAFLILLLAGCATQLNKIIVQPDTVSLMPAAWVISWSPGMPTHPASSGGSWSFDFPVSDGVHYVMVPYTASKPHKTLTITFRVTPISGNPKFVSVNQCPGGMPAGFRPMLERQGDALLASQEFYRWWSAFGYFNLVADGQVHTITVPLTPNRWTSVFGKTSTTEFATSMDNLMGVGMTFGGGCAYGHGVWVTGGKARFELINYQIQ